MPLSLVIGWFTLGFAFAAIGLYGPVMTKAALQKIRAIKALQEANRVSRETTTQAKEMAEVERTIAEAREGELQALRDLAALGQEHNELLKKYGEVLEEYNALGNEALEDTKEFNELLTKYEALFIEHKALLWRAGGGVEGTA